MDEADGAGVEGAGVDAGVGSGCGSDQMSTSFGAQVCEGGEVVESESRSVCTGVTYNPVPIEELADIPSCASPCPPRSSGSLPMSNKPPFSLPAPATVGPVVESTAMSLALKSSRMVLSTCASYAGVGSTELCLRWTRLLSEPGDAAPSDIELGLGALVELIPSPRRGVRSCCSPVERRERRVGKQHENTVCRNCSMMRQNNSHSLLLLLDVAVQRSNCPGGCTSADPMRRRSNGKSDST